MGIYVIGMHRSGTSALAGLLSALCQLPSGRLAVDSNPAGQWERPELRPALELLLAWRRVTWAEPPAETTPVDPPAALGAYAARVFDRHCSGPFLWKDPRLCLTIDHWLTLPQEEPRIVFVHRQPHEVARSLHQRNGWPLERGLALWERTNRNAVTRLGGREVFVVGHRRLLDRPERVVAELADWLGHHDPNARSRAVATIQPTPPPAPPSPIAVGTVELTPARSALAERLGRASGPTRLDLSGVGHESPATGDQLGSPSRSELARRMVRAVVAAPRRHRLEIAEPPGPR